MGPIAHPGRMMRWGRNAVKRWATGGQEKTQPKTVEVGVLVEVWAPFVLAEGP